MVANTPEKTIAGYDCETDRIAGENVLPKIVCAAISCGETRALSAHVEPELKTNIEALFGSESGVHTVCHNASYDLGVTCRTFPDLFPMVFEALSAGRVSCTIIREKLLHLTTHGGIDFAPLPGGETERLEYKLATLVKRYFDIDIADAKDEDDAWRINYAALRGLPASEYPEDAAQYVSDDALYAERIWYEQEELRQQQIKTTGIDPFETESFRVACDFVLGLMSAWGMTVDAEEFYRVQGWLKDELKPENVKLLVEEKILRPAVPPRPYANGAEDEDGNPKMTKGDKESVDTKRMREFVLQLKEALPDDVQIKYTKPSKRFPKGQLSYDAEWLDDHAHLNPVLAQYQHRQKLQKLVTTELPRMCLLDEEGKHTETVAPVVHPCYDVLKRTGRTSSFASKLYPSFNCQNVDPRVRGCYIPRPGHIFFSIDYSGMELGTLGQTCLNLFGRSVLADKINAGVDAHAYLAASIAYNVDEDFRLLCDDAGVKDTDDIYDCFIPMKKQPSESKVGKFFKHYRTLAKPTGLGYPGGLGPKTFRQYAKATYGLLIDQETAELLHNVWKVVYPEMDRYFEHINTKCLDARNSPRTFKYIDDNGIEQTKEQDVYAYRTPYGLYRAGCDYCAAANGNGLQSPSAEGALTGVFNVMRSCYDYSMNSPLFNIVRPIAFVHDEIVGELPDDSRAHDLILEMEQIMVQSMSQVTPDVTPRVESALMRRWNKAAEPVFDATGRLIIWTPPKENAA